MSNVRTGGGLLASIAALRPQACVTALWTEGYAARAIVGCVEPRSASLAAIAVEFDEAPPRAAYLAQHSNSAPTRSAGGDGHMRANTL
jgi:hypothetical protein